MVRKILASLLLASTLTAAPEPLQRDTQTKKLIQTELNLSDVTLTLGSVSISDSAGIRTIPLGSTNGTKIGATGNKIGFLGATPIVRPSGNLFTAWVNLGLGTAPSLTTANVTGLDTSLADLEEALNLPSVVVQHPDGTSLVYPPSADTDAARGTALLAAVTAAVAGDVIILGPGTFLTSLLELPADVSLRGSGIGATIIEGSSTLLLTPGDNSVIADITFDCSASPFAIPIGNTIDTTQTFNNVSVYRCKLIGKDDCFLFQVGTIGSITAYDCIVQSRWDCVLMNQTGASFTSYNCDFVSTGTGTNNIARCISGVDGIVKIYGGTLKATGGTSQNVAVQSGTLAGNIIELHNLTIESGTGGSVANADLAQQGSATLRINNVARTDGAALSTTGSITTLSRNLIREKNLSDLTSATTARTNLGLDVPAVIAPTLLNSWANYGSGLEPAGYFKDYSGRVWLSGVIKDGTTTSATALFTLPSGYRPVSQRVFAVDNNGALGEIQILTNGNVSIYLGGNTYLSLDGISFRTD